MTTTLTRIQLAVFSIVTVLAVGYGAVRYFDVGAVLAPPYEVRAQFASAGGIYERADVDLLGTRVGSVRDIEAGPGTGTTVVLAIDRGVEIPQDVRATIGNKSAIGEQYVELAPQSAGGPHLEGGDVIPLDRTQSPVDVASLLQNLDALAGSVPVDDLRAVITELATALDGVGGQLGTLIDSTDRLSRASLDNVETLTTLIDDARTVLDTQVAKGPQTATYLRELAGLTSELRRIDDSFDELFGNGVRAGVEVSNLLADNQAALPVLLNNLVSVTTVAADRTAPLRKTLVLFPYALEVGATGVRRCGSFDVKTGEPVEGTCRYDAQGRPIYSAYLGMQLPQPPGSSPYFPCTEGYEGTVKYQPNGQPLEGGSPQELDSPPNYQVACTASPTDPDTPNVRGSQNVLGEAGTAGRAPTGFGLYNPASGILTGPEGSYDLDGSDDPRPPTGAGGLRWLLEHPMS